MVLPYTDVQYVTATVGSLRDTDGNVVPATVSFDPQFSVAVHLASGDVVYGARLVRRIDATTPAISVDLIASDTTGLSVTDFDWLITIQTRPQAGAAAKVVTRTRRVRLPKGIPLIDVDLLADWPTQDLPDLAIPVVSSVAGLAGTVTAAQLRAALGVSGGGAGSAVVHQQTTPSASWVITHGLGRLPLVDVFVAGEQVEADISVTATGASVVFPTPTAGVAVLA